jgi:hypothetical protein
MVIAPGGVDLGGRTGRQDFHLPERSGCSGCTATIAVTRAGGDGMTHPSGVPVFERFFRSVASIDIDKNDVRRFRDFVEQMIDDIAITGRALAKWNGRDVIAPQDLPITKGVQERMREFDKLDEAEEIRELLRQSVRRPPADVTFSEETDQLLPELFGGLSVALARSFRVIDPKLTNPSTEHWERAFDLFRLVL